MKPAQQRIAIAEACGWSEIQDPIMFSALMDTPAGIAPGQMERLFSTIPDYLNDLNAMHEAEKRLTFIQRYQYIVKIGFREQRVWDGSFNGLNATAAQRAEAFLRTLNLWTDS